MKLKMARKTIEVESVRLQVNEMLRDGYHSPDERRGMIAVLENILMRSGNYHGFQCLGADEVPEGEKPGIHWDKMRYDGVKDDRFTDTDPTRVKYY